MTRIAGTLIVGLACTFVACRPAPLANPGDPAPQPRENTPVGGDRDEHGCIPSAGYTWCAKENACVRSWVLAKAKGFANDKPSFEAYCDPVRLGGDRDEHGCIGSAGATWCAKENACVRSWELAAAKGFPNDKASFEGYCNPVIVGADRDEHGCIGSAGYSWCARENVCVRPWELAAAKGFTSDPASFSTYCAVAAPPGSDRDAHGCIGSAGYTWCARENACVRSWELATAKGFTNDAASFAAYCASKP